MNVRSANESWTSGIFKFLIFSAVGIFMFFIPINMGGKTTIPLDHIVTGIKKSVPFIAKLYALIIIIVGSILPFKDKTWNKDKVRALFSIFKLVGLVVAFMVYYRSGPEWLLEKDMGPFLFSKLVVPVGLIVPIGAIFLSFLVGYGLLEFIGVLMEPIMKPIFKTPGRSAIDAVASFVGSYSIGLLITNKVFKEGKYTIKEASIIATGFSTVSATFMIIVAKTLGLMEMWNTYFWTTLIVTFLVTAITVRLFPLSKKSEKYYEDKDSEIFNRQGNIFINAWKEGIKAANISKNMAMNIKENLLDGIKMAMGILPSIMSIGLFGLVLAKYTSLFDYMGYIFYPFIKLLQIPEPMLAAKASAVGIAEMFLPALVVKSAPLITKFVIGVVCISQVLFFSASIPCILSTDIPIDLKEIVLIWIERTILTLILVMPMVFILF
ncbi:MAG: YjiH family protein [Anaeromicrobium sp.]|jgi:nucleoside recognition membrane protein YjiH|uniref:YjiH family protein n=1 Tax=Anaeromicrobium sp. TaxID=1929132 RepID=UPI0025F43C5B|nr:YjiH family protein [Anaeromicrobium sp.]MCT4592881.1 YjiH family protein [Anaeromicrobium sp.]